MALCPVCETFETECGWYACNECLDEYGTDPARLESIAAHRARARFHADIERATQLIIDALTQPARRT